MRTTSALESYNAKLLRNLPKKGNFYKFMKRIADEELSQSREMKMLVDSAGGSIDRTSRKRKYKDKNVLIRESSDALMNGTINVMEFLKRVTYDGNIVDKNLAKYVTTEQYISDNGHSTEEELHDDEVDANQQMKTEAIAAAAVEDSHLCGICHDKRKDTMFLPCKDLKSCSDCASALKARSEEGEPFMCPFCKVVVENVICGIYL